MAIHEYLVKQKFLGTAEILAQEAGISGSHLANGSGSSATSSALLKDMLERKWTSVAKLKKENDELIK